MNIDDFPLRGIEKGFTEVLFEGCYYLFPIFVEREKSLRLILIVERLFFQKQLSYTKFLLIWGKPLQELVLLYIFL